MYTYHHTTYERDSSLFYSQVDQTQADQEKEVRHLLPNSVLALGSSTARGRFLKQVPQTNHLVSAFMGCPQPSLPAALINVRKETDLEDEKAVPVERRASRQKRDVVFREPDAPGKIAVPDAVMDLAFARVPDFSTGYTTPTVRAAEDALTPVTFWSDTMRAMGLRDKYGPNAVLPAGEYPRVPVMVIGLTEDLQPVHFADDNQTGRAVTTFPRADNTRYDVLRYMLSRKCRWTDLRARVMVQRSDRGFHFLFAFPMWCIFAATSERDNVFPFMHCFACFVPVASNQPERPKVFRGMAPVLKRAIAGVPHLSGSLCAALNEARVQIAKAGLNYKGSTFLFDKSTRLPKGHVVVPVGWGATTLRHVINDMSDTLLPLVRYTSAYDRTEAQREMQYITECLEATRRKLQYNTYSPDGGVWSVYLSPNARYATKDLHMIDALGDLARFVFSYVHDGHLAPESAVNEKPWRHDPLCNPLQGQRRTRALEL